MRVLIFIVVVAQLGLGQDYVVLEVEGRDESWGAPAAELASWRKARRLSFDPDALGGLVETLRPLQPRYVAVVIPPNVLEFDFARRFLQAATELDDDPFVDFSYGFITGATSAEALAFVKRCIAADKKPRKARLARVAGGVETSRRWSYPFQLRRSSVKGLALWVAGEETHPDEGHDRAFVHEHLPKLADASVVEFIGHGYPREIVGGPDWKDLRQLRLDRAVVLNVGCYTGVTETYFEDDWNAGKVKRKTIPLEESFALGILRSGAVGYTAYTCPRPAGPELDTDLCALVAEGASLGDARRRDYDKIVLGYLGYGSPRLALAPVKAGNPVRRAADVVREVMLELGTGGVLFGDPALVPFKAKHGEALVAVRTKAVKGGLRVDVSCPAHALFTQCNDPTTKEWGGVAMKVIARVPLKKAHVKEVAVEKLEIGGRDTESRLVWAVEEDQGERYLQVKTLFPRQQRGRALKLVLKVSTTTNAREGKRLGGVLKPPRYVAKDLTSAAVAPELVAIAARYGASRAALEAALRAHAAAMGNAQLDVTKTRAALKARGADGFRALCALIEVGHCSTYTRALLQVTLAPKEVGHLLALAQRKDLPNYGCWVATRALGAVDTPQVRAFVLERLAKERDAGVFTCLAEAAAALKEKRATKPIGERLVACEPAYKFLGQKLVTSLVAIDQEAAVPYLERYARNEKAPQRKLALQLLDRLAKKR